MNLRSGMTGFWQASGRNDLTHGERVPLNLRHAEGLSMIFDIRLILLTGISILTATGP
jgi:lipopolysaccharide/colanic/teichoic acid biosynthesis glycosyltransferase